MKSRTIFDEEMAEEYVQNKADKGNFDLEQFGKAYFSESSMKQAYLAGLKAGKPKWHKVADGDLPEEDLRQRTHGYYLTASKHKSYKGFVFEVAYFTGVIFTKGGDILDNVIAWCEIPTYTEE